MFRVRQNNNLPATRIYETDRPSARYQRNLLILFLVLLRRGAHAGGKKYKANTVYYTHPVTLFRQRVSPIYDRLVLPRQRRAAAAVVRGIPECATPLRVKRFILFGCFGQPPPPLSLAHPLSLPKIPLFSLSLSLSLNFSPYNLRFCHAAEYDCSCRECRAVHPPQAADG